MTIIIEAVGPKGKTYEFSNSKEPNVGKIKFIIFLCYSV